MSRRVEKDLGFYYGNGVFNSKKDRGRAAKNLVDYILKKRGCTTGDCRFESSITLVGHSHGGNVAIQAVPMLRKKLDKMGYSDVKINLITVSTPAETKKNDIENAGTHEDIINKHINLYNRIDGIQTVGARIFG